jgi:hypothetical protein
VRAGSTASLEAIARLPEDHLPKAGRRAETFDHYLLLAHQAIYRLLATPAR